MINSEDILPDITAGWEKIDFNDQAIDAWILNAEGGRQIVLMHFYQDSFSDEFHINDYSQWGVILDGEMTLWTDRKRVLKKGDVFVVPNEMPHRVEIKAGYKDLTVFDGPRHVTKKGG